MPTVDFIRGLSDLDQEGTCREVRGRGEGRRKIWLEKEEKILKENKKQEKDRKKQAEKLEEEEMKQERDKKK
jgi:hypothetical protein